MTNLHVLLCRKGSECYTVVVKDTVDGALQSMRAYYDDVKYIREEPDGSPNIRKWKGTRYVGSSVIKHCVFNSLFITRKKTPLSET